MTSRDFNFLTLENFYNKWLENVPLDGLEPSNQL